MSGLQNFVRGNRNGQAGGQNGQLSVNPHRQAVAANAKVPMKAHVARPPTAIGQYARGDGTAQIQSSFVQPQPRPSGEDRKRDLYDTDAESIDTTINQSTIQVENSPQLEQQSLQPAGEQHQTGGHENTPDRGSDEGSEEDESEAGFDFTDRQMQYLEQHGKLDISNQEQARFLSLGPSYLFPDVDGDSYPTTTDGNPTEWNEPQDSHVGDNSPSPSPQPVYQQRFDAMLLSHQAPEERSGPVANSSLPQNANVWRQGAQIREQQRNDSAERARARSDRQHITAHLPTSQPPSYTQAANEPHLDAPLSKQAQPIPITQGEQSSLPQRSARLPLGSARIHTPLPRIEEPTNALQHVPISRVKTVFVAQQHTDIASGVTVPSLYDGDYDPEAVFKMDYDQLIVESFDQDPRNQEHILPEDMHRKSLDERLQFVQRELDSVAQAHFFSALPTSEWEDAGDWFLDQFSVIIKKTRDARQNKRKAAQGFEKEIEQRHHHIAKKQRLVEDAMAKMKAQGEGLVPKSPRASKSPRPRKD